MKRYTMLFTTSGVRRAVYLSLVTSLIAGAHVRAETRHVDKRVAPVYPELARRMHVSGSVKVAATVAADGSVTGTKPMAGNAILSSAAEEAVRKWVFAPSDAATTETVEVNFEGTN